MDPRGHKRSKPYNSAAQDPLDDGARAYRDRQRRLNPTLQEVVRKELLKRLDYGIIYPIFESEWISPVQVILNKTRITMIRNDKNELILSRV